MRKLFSFLSGGPGVVILLLGLAGAVTAYIHQREVAAVARAEMQRQLDSLQAAWHADSVAAALRDSARIDSIRAFQDSIDKVQAKASAAAKDFDFARRALRSIIPNGQRVLLDSMVAAHERETTSLRAALAYADSVHQIDVARIYDRDQQLAHLRSDLARLTGQIATLTKRAHPGPVQAVLQSPVTHAVAFAVGVGTGLAAH